MRKFAMACTFVFAAMVASAHQGSVWIDAAKDPAVKAVATAMHRVGVHKVKIADGQITVGDLYMGESEPAMHALLATGAFTKSGDWTGVKAYVEAITTLPGAAKSDVEAGCRAALDAVYKDEANRSVAMAATIFAITAQRVATGKEPASDEAGKLAFLLARNLQDDQRLDKVTNDAKQALFERLILNTALLNIALETAKDDGEKKALKKQCVDLLNAMLN